LLPVVALASSLVLARDLPEFADARISRNDWGNLRTGVRAIVDVKCHDDRERLNYICSSDERKSVWIFTVPEHPAHPAVVEREVMRVGDSVRVRSRGYFAGSEAAFAEWFAGFAELDRQ
jgi:hypothetical protein